MNPWLQRLATWWQRLIGRWPGAAAPSSKPPTLPRLPAPPLALRRCVSVVVPALNEAARIADVVRHALADPATAEVVVIDDSSIDDTVALARAAGARVATSAMLGKGASMRDGALTAGHELLVFLDGDLAGLRPGVVSDLARPLAEDRADFVKARFGRSGGRVTELTAKPMLKVFFPEISHFSQPLGGLIAARRSLLRALAFEDGYGVDVGLLIDAHRAGARLAEVDIGSLEHDSQPLVDLALMANEVSRVIYQRAKAAGRLHVEQIAAMHETQRQAAAALDYILTRRRGRTRLLLLDMDGTITPERFVVQLARATGVEAALEALMDRPSQDSATRSQRIAALFRFVHQQQFERVAREMPLRQGVVNWVNCMRRAGFMVGVVSDSWFVAADILRRRVFADFALAHTLQFDGEVCSGVVHLNPAFMPMVAGEKPELCKSHVIRRFRGDPGEPRVQEVWAIGDNDNDLGMLREADRAFVVEPKSPHLKHEADAPQVGSFEDLMLHVPKGRGVPSASEGARASGG
ncbi:MAG: glycosyltransferase [Rubrivivax sp.]|nr:glycosyltransferase [Rubrivivax sp.]